MTKVDVRNDVIMKILRIHKLTSRGPLIETRLSGIHDSEQRVYGFGRGAHLGPRAISLPSTLFKSVFLQMLVGGRKETDT